MPAERGGDEDGNRAAVTLDQAGYTIGHATKIEKPSAIRI